MSGTRKRGRTKQTTLTLSAASQRRSSVPALPSTLPPEIEAASLSQAGEGETEELQLEDMASGGSASVLDKIFEKLEALDRKVDLQTAKIDQNTESLNRLTGQVAQNVQSIGELKEAVGENRKLAEDTSQRLGELEKEVRPLSKQVGEHQIHFLMTELRNREANLRIRSIPEVEEDNLIEFLTKEFSKFWKLEEKDFKIVSAFRLGRFRRKEKPRDCLIILRSKEERDKILGLHYGKSLDILDKRIEIYKDIPKQLLDLRSDYTELARLLRSNSIIFRWEFPQGLSFTFRGKKIKIRTLEDRDKFLEAHGEDLHKGLGAPGPEPSGEPAPSDPQGPENKVPPQQE